MRAPNTRVPSWNPRPRASVARSPAAVPRAKVQRIAAQYKSSRRREQIVRMESVPSLRYQNAKIHASMTAKTAVLRYRLTPRPSVSASVICVPTMLTSTTVSQYIQGT